MPRILLVRCNEHLSGSSRISSISGVFPALGLAYIAAVIRRARYAVSVLDAHALNLSWDAFASYIRRYPSDIILFTSTTLGWPQVVKAAAIVKRILPESIVGAGGPQITAYPRESLAAAGIDIVFCGEGEDTVLDFLEKFSGSGDITGIPGTAVRKDGEIVVNPPRNEISDLDALPFPAVDLLPYDRYYAVNVKRPFFTMITSRGCPHRCSFCAQVYNGGGFRLRSAGNVVDEMEFYVRRHRARELVIFDDTFTVDKKRVLDICGLIESRNLKFDWNIRTRVDAVDEEIMRNLKRAGCRRVQMGVESGSQEVLDAMNKGITIRQIKDAFGTAQKLGFETGAYFMLGYPGESLESMRKTLRLSRELDPHWATFSITVPLPHTRIYACALANGRIKTDYWREFTLGSTQRNPPLFTSPEYDEASLNRLKLKAYICFYMRPRAIIRLVFSRLFIKNIYEFIKIVLTY